MFQLCSCWIKRKSFYKKADKNLVKNIQKLDLISHGKIFEYPIEAIKYLELISKKIKKFDGGLLAFDYGFTEKKGINTLQAIKKHKYNDIFRDPGNVDISSHINFWLFDKILKKNNLYVEKIITQNEFLQKMGILERADILSKKMNFSDKANMYYRLKRLLGYKEMGSLFKVLFAKKKGKKFSLGF